MRPFSSLIFRELSERRLVVVVAGVVGVITPVVAAAVGGSVAVLSLVVGVTLGHAVALLVGAGVVNRPLREGRLGFFFDRPISASAIWWGKLLGAVVLAAAVQLLAAAPGLVWAFFAGAAEAAASQDARTAPLLLVASLVGLVGSALVGHFLGALVSSSSKISWLDFVALMLSVLLGLAAYATLRSFRAETALVWLGVMLVGPALVGMALGGWRQVREGRLDRARGHRVLSTTVWGLTLGAALLSLGFSRWTVGVPPDAMTVRGVEGAADGSFVVRSIRWQEGHPRHGVEARFLVDAESGRWQRLEGVPAGPATTLSPEGSRVLWASSTRRMGERRLRAWLGETAGPGSLGAVAEIAVDDLDGLSAWQLLAGGERVVDVALRRDGPRTGDWRMRVRLWETAESGSLLEEWVDLAGAVRWERPRVRFFVDGDDLRLFVQDGHRLGLWRIEAAGSSREPELAEVASRPLAPGDGTRVWFGEEGERVLVEEPAEAFEGFRTFPGSGTGRSGVGLVVRDGDLRELWRLPPVESRVFSVQLVGERVLVDVSTGAGAPTDADRRVGLLVGGPDGWSELYDDLLIFGSSVAIDRDRVLVFERHRRSAPEPEFSEMEPAIFDLRTGTVRPLPDEVAAALEGRASLGSLPWGSDIRAQRELPPLLRQLYASAPELGTESSLVRIDWESGVVEPMFR